MSGSEGSRALRNVISSYERGVLTEGELFDEVASRVYHLVFDVIGTLGNPGIGADLPEAESLLEQCRETVALAAQDQPGLCVLLLTAVDDGVDGIRRHHRSWRRTRDALVELRNSAASPQRSEELAVLARFAVSARDDRLAEEVARSAAELDERAVLELIASDAEVLGARHAHAFAARALSASTTPQGDA